MLLISSLLKKSTQSESNIENILKPFKENLTEFKQKVDNIHTEDTTQRASLQAEIKFISTLNQQLSQEAKNLTTALKGDSKTQGDWGEFILEHILENTGLTKGREYLVQETYKDELGKSKRPDIILKLPKQRDIIIDSKVSLNAYSRYISCEDANEKEKQLSEHILSIKNHIMDLSRKDYQNIPELHTLDFVMMFIPIEPAFMTAVQHNQQLWEFAYSKRIFLISPTNLIVALKMVDQLWQKEKQQLNASKISERGRLLYDQFARFVENMIAIEKKIDDLSTTHSAAMNQLKTGKGNLIGQALKLKKLGVTPNKKNPLVEEVDESD